jgi:Brp/Blh family beta-carotene 15,15'-monooxygenase
MNLLSKFSIIISFFSLWLCSFVSAENQLFIGFAFILSFGILHGSNDIFVLKKILLKSENFSFFKILLLYVLFILCCILLFYYFPIIILVLFILFSGYHFGEQQLIYLNNKSETSSNLFLQSYQTLYGLLILFLLFEFHNNEVILVISDISKFRLNPLVITYGLLIIVILFLVFSVQILKTNSNNRKLLLKELFYLIVFSIIFKVSSLIWGFTIYFVVWHSLPSIINQVSFLYGEFSFINFLKYFKTALPYWLISLFGLGMFYFFSSELKLFNSLFFSFLAAITFPHVLVIYNMIRKFKYAK